jgi:chitinase
MLRTQYGFDGFDFNIRQGLIGSGSFANPTGDIEVLAGIITQLRDLYPNMLLTLTSQMESISATQGFDSIWGNYASLVMKTAPALNWVGIQLYDSECCFGIVAVCYGLDNPKSSETYVAMVTNLLENWPDKGAAGQATGFQPYMSYLDPSQVVLGFSMKGSSNANTTMILASQVKRALQCLRTGDSSCEGYTPPRTYPNIGGVSEWELSYEEANNYLFTRSLHQCIVNSNCF